MQDIEQELKKIQDIEQELEMSQSGTYAPHYMFQNMQKRGFPGIAICSCSDRFKLREGRVRAKRHLLSRLMHQPHIIVTLDKHRALYPVRPIINDVPQVKEVITTESGAKKQIHTLDDAVGVEEQELRIKLAWLERTSDAVERRLGDRANKIGAMDRTIIALRKDVADRNALIKEQSDIIRRFRAMRDLSPEEPKTGVLMRTQRFYFDGPWGDPAKNTIDSNTPVADWVLIDEVTSVGGTKK
jgi:Mg2+ and Co2+ transporter CorA